MIEFLAACVVAGTPLAFATVGELITEKTGNLNLGVEGMMLMGAVMGFFTGLNTASPFMALAAAALAGAGGALIYAFVTVSLKANQVVTGLTLTITSFFSKIAIPGLGQIPVIGPIFFQQDVFVYLSYVICAAAAVYLYRTRMGMNLKALGENTAAADASGININLYKYVHVLIGGALCGLGGAYLSLVRIPIWQEDVVNGRGWIAVALVIFVAWNPIKGFFGAALFGGLSIIGLRFQAMGLGISQYLVDMIPYIATIIIVIISTHKRKKESQPPGDLGNNYFREER